MTFEEGPLKGMDIPDVEVHDDDHERNLDLIKFKPGMRVYIKNEQDKFEEWIFVKEEQEKVVLEKRFIYKDKDVGIVPNAQLRHVMPLAQLKKEHLAGSKYFEEIENLAQHADDLLAEREKNSEQVS